MAAEVAKHRSCVDVLEIAVAEAVQPVTDLRFELEVIQTPYPAAHAWPGYRAGVRTNSDRGILLTGPSHGGSAQAVSTVVMSGHPELAGEAWRASRDSRPARASGLEYKMLV
jgi:hypothetical protein